VSLLTFRALLLVALAVALSGSLVVVAKVLLPVIGVAQAICAAGARGRGYGQRARRMNAPSCGRRSGEAGRALTVVHDKIIHLAPVSDQLCVLLLRDLIVNGVIVVGSLHAAR
jgi:hypothetical protein